jgi:hypothetical protein
MVFFSFNGEKGNIWQVKVKKITQLRGKYGTITGKIWSNYEESTEQSRGNHGAIGRKSRK